jgi:hypothetical protein
MSAGSRPTREQLFQALLDHLRANTVSFQTYSRRMMHYSEVAEKLLPCLILWEWPENTDYRPGRGLPRDYWEAMVAVYFVNPSKAINGDPNTGVAGATIINPLLDEVRAALAPDDDTTNSFTLGGLVEWIRVEGRTIIETGDTDADGRGGAFMPVRISVP